jgi:hypothetical protein
VCRLLSLAYPGETSELSRIVARDAFLDSLGDAEMRIKILETGASSLEEAFATAIGLRFESYRASSAWCPDGSRHKVRAANLPITENFGDRIRLEARFAESRFAETRM